MATFFGRVLCGFLSISLALLPVAVWADIRIPMGTRVYVSTMQELIGKKGQVEVGQMVPCQVWRDVVVDRQVVIASALAGRTPPRGAAPGRGRPIERLSCAD